MDRRRSAIAILALVNFAAPAVAEAQSPMRPRRIGVLGFSNPAAGRAYFAHFADELAKLGWIEGRNLQSTYRYADGDVARLPALAAELVALEPDVLFSSNSAGSIALARATSRIPVVISGVADPLAMGLVNSLARPGGNVTGTAGSPGDGTITGKRLEILKQLLPRFSRLAIIYDPRDPESQDLREFQEYSERLGLRVDPVRASNLSEIRAALKVLSNQPPDAIYLILNAANYANRDIVCAETLQMRMPTMSAFAQFADSGCFVSYGSSFDEVARESARYVDRILRGGNPAEIPVSQPARFELVINARTAASIGLSIPSNVRLIADRVID